MRTIETQGSLELCQDQNGTLFVRMTNSGKVDSLSTVRKWHHLDGTRLNGSQAATVVGWFNAAVKGEFDKGIEQ